VPVLYGAEKAIEGGKPGRRGRKVRNQCYRGREATRKHIKLKVGRGEGGNEVNSRKRRIT